MNKAASQAFFMVDCMFSPDQFQPVPKKLELSRYTAESALQNNTITRKNPLFEAVFQGF